MSIAAHIGGLWPCLGVSLCLALVGCSDPQTVFTEAEPGSVVLPGPDAGGDRDVPDLSCAQDIDCAEGSLCCQGQCTRTTSCEALEPCQVHGEACLLPRDSALEAQGDGFYCARLAQTDGPTCLQACDADFSAGGCPSDSFCLSVGGDPEPVTLCVPGECEEHSECSFLGLDGGTCLPFGNSANFCFSAGPVQQGETCTGEMRCAPGLYCLGFGVLATCEPLCDMWSGESLCGREQACGFLTAGTGVCRSKTVEGREVAQSCEPLGDWCDDGLQCFDFQTGGEPLPLCTAWCRPGTDDCRGRFQNQQGFCRTVFSDGAGEPLEDVGLCL